jgi:SAM-dependent methyltransferase
MSGSIERSDNERTTVSSAVSTGRRGTDSADYAAAYFHGYSGPPYTYDEPHWQTFFRRIADSLVALFAPGTSYDAGCAKGFLVRALAERGVDARGGDISEYAIADAPADLAVRLEVRDLTEPLPGRYDLITCIEVLEHLSPEDARTALVNLCAVTDRVVLSSTPDDFTEPTHINIRTPAAWAQEFAVQGFFRRTDVDASFISPWAVVFDRRNQSVAEVVAAYESLLAPTLRELQEKRQALLVSRRELDEHTAPVEIERDRLATELAGSHAELAGTLTELARTRGELEALGSADLFQERMNRLAMADELIGLRAELAQVRVETETAIAAASQEADRLRQVLDVTLADLAQARELAGEARTAATRARDEADQLVVERDAIKSSVTWRIGTKAMAPVRAVRRLVRR